MKPDEKIANKYLQSNGFQNAVYEPLGNSSPDFAINGEIAVEVTRLNEFTLAKEHPEPLDQPEHDLRERIRGILKSFDTAHLVASAFLVIDYHTRVKIGRELGNKIKDVLIAHLKFIDEPKTYRISDVTLRFFPLKTQRTNPYIFEVYGESNVEVVQNLYNSLKVILPKKERKIHVNKARYPKWWLILIDHITFGSIDEYDLCEVREMLDIQHSFDRVIFVSPSEPSIACEL